MLIANVSMYLSSKSQPLPGTVAKPLRRMACKGEDGIQPLMLRERIRVDGVAADASFNASTGELRWGSSAGVNWCLMMESEVLGFRTKGVKIIVKAFVFASKGASFGASGGKLARTRKDFVLEMPSEQCAMIWSDKFGDLINLFGTLLQFQT